MIILSDFVLISCVLKYVLKSELCCTQQCEMWKFCSCVVTKLYLLYAFFWAFPRRLNFICQHFGMLCLFHLHRWVDNCPPMKME